MSQVKRFFMLPTFLPITNYSVKLEVIFCVQAVMTPLPLLGGDNSGANGINNRGQVIGIAENTTPDPTCLAPQVLQLKPVLWDKSEVQELPTFPGDSDGAGL